MKLCHYSNDRYGVWLVLNKSYDIRFLLYLILCIWLKFLFYGHHVIAIYPTNLLIFLDELVLTCMHDAQIVLVATVLATKDLPTYTEVLFAPDLFLVFSRAKNIFRDTRVI